MFSPPLSPLTPRRPPGDGELPRSYNSEATMSEAASETGSANSNQDEMTMFHVVFVMNPPALEYHIRLQEMYDNVVKKTAKALRYEQARSNAAYQDAKKMQTGVEERLTKKGLSVPPYEFLELIGKGAYGRVYKRQVKNLT